MKSFRHYGIMPKEWKQGRVSDEIYFDKDILMEIFTYLLKEEFGSEFRPYIGIIQNHLNAPYVYFDIKKGKSEHNYVASFCLSTIFISPQIMVSSRTYIERDYRRKEYSYKLMRIKEYIAKAYGCECIMATVNNSNTIQCHVLEKTGWNRIQTLSETSIWTKILGED